MKLEETAELTVITELEETTKLTVLRTGYNIKGGERGTIVRTKHLFVVEDIESLHSMNSLLNKRTQTTGQRPTWRYVPHPTSSDVTQGEAVSHHYQQWQELPPFHRLATTLAATT